MIHEFPLLPSSVSVRHLFIEASIWKAGKSEESCLPYGFAPLREIIHAKTWSLPIGRQDAKRFFIEAYLP